MDNESGKPGIPRRDFIIGAGGAVALIALGAVKWCPTNDVCRPPGGEDAARMLGSCVRCDKCMEVCPNGIIVPSHIEDGIASMRTPKINFSLSRTQLNGKLGWCDHCQTANGGIAKCVQVCPSGALDEIANAAFFDTMIIGTAQINTNWCLAWRLKGCTICKNACPVNAIEFDGNNRPVVVEDACNGCGACEQACVSLESTSVGDGEEGGRGTMTARAITVVPISKARG